MTQDFVAGFLLAAELFAALGLAFYIRKRKVGGIHFAKFGRVQLSICILRKRQPPQLG